MKIHVEAFASAGDVLGRDSLEITLPEGAGLAELRAELMSRYPALEPIWPRLAVAVDDELAAGERALSDGSRVALLPPVSGGSGALPRVALVEEAIDAAAVERSVADPSCGAIVVFRGSVRDHHEGRAVVRLTYSAQRPMAEKALGRIVSELETGGCRVGIVHRLGEVPVGEASVVIAVAAPHRQTAYEASRAALERIKHEVPIWKQEHYADGGVAWREEEPLSDVGHRSSTSPGWQGLGLRNVSGRAQRIASGATGRISLGEPATAGSARGRMRTSAVPRE